MSGSEQRPRLALRRYARRGGRVSPAVVVLALAAAAAVAVFGFQRWRSGHVTIAFVHAAGAPPDLELTIFPDQLAFASPSPPPPLGVVALAGSMSATLDAEVVPDRAVVRYRGKGVGAGVVYVRLGEPVPPVILAAPRTIRGRVGEPIGFWCFGWRCAGMLPVVDAEVVVMAGGEHGIELASARTDADGRFVLGGVAADAHPLSLRVRGRGCAIAHVEVPSAAVGGEVLAAVRRTVPLRGRIAAPPGVDVTGLVVLARGLPGVEAVPAADGTFALDHIPPGLEPRLLVYGLGPFHGCPETWATRGAEVRLEVRAAGVVRGTVVDAASGRAVGGAHVFADGGAATRARADGTFELIRVLPGAAELTAQFQPERKPRQRRAPVRTGHVRVDAPAGQVLEGVRIPISVR